MTKSDFESDEKAMYIYNQLINTQEYMDRLGYAEMPSEQYESWLRSVEAEGRRQEHRNKERMLMGQIGN